MSNEISPRLMLLGEKVDTRETRSEAHFARTRRARYTLNVSISVSLSVFPRCLCLPRKTQGKEGEKQKTKGTQNLEPTFLLTVSLPVSLSVSLAVSHYQGKQKGDREGDKTETKGRQKGNRIGSPICHGPGGARYTFTNYLPFCLPLCLPRCVPLYQGQDKGDRGRQKRHKIGSCLCPGGHVTILLTVSLVVSLSLPFCRPFCLASGFGFAHTWLRVQTSLKSTPHTPQGRGLYSIALSLGVCAELILGLFGPLRLRRLG
jgi:hypothetical protein